MDKRVKIITPQGLDISNYSMDQLEALMGHMDNIILSTVRQCQDTVLITMDKNLRIKARAMNIPTLAFISSIE
jgi:rRNA-processing protein FCF1